MRSRSRARGNQTRRNRPAAPQPYIFPSIRTEAGLRTDLTRRNEEGMARAIPSRRTPSGRLEVVLGCELHPAITKLGSRGTGGFGVVVVDQRGPIAYAGEAELVIRRAVDTERRVRVVEPVGRR